MIILETSFAFPGTVPLHIRYWRKSSSSTSGTRPTARPFGEKRDNDRGASSREAPHGLEPARPHPKGAAPAPWRTHFQAPPHRQDSPLCPAKGTSGAPPPAAPDPDDGSTLLVTTQPWDADPPAAPRGRV